MVVDTSAVVAIILREPAGDRLLDRIVAAPPREISMASYVESASVLGPRGVTHERLDAFLQSLSITLVPVDEAQGRAAIQARVAYGKGTGHSAQLNFGDTFTYALAKVRGAPLLFVGDDFAHTDLVSALA